ncbi:hypothetical protein LTR09_005044 [Extremus antarcticus]|uniref:Uncharacterized protein n=1 Tax=Extremus antarcticus TaxID=702011 RepID=A0AAJ0DPH2_9PEZI|nr:hypothetical protein LTR09_005044 [Extremus antarcticus]
MDIQSKGVVLSAPDREKHSSSRAKQDFTFSASGPKAPSFPPQNTVPPTKSQPHGAAAATTRSRSDRKVRFEEAAPTQHLDTIPSAQAKDQVLVKKASRPDPAKAGKLEKLVTALQKKLAIGDFKAPRKLPKDVTPVTEKEAHATAAASEPSLEDITAIAAAAAARTMRSHPSRNAEGTAEEARKRRTEQTDYLEQTINDSLRRVLASVRAEALAQAQVTQRKLDEAGQFAVNSYKHWERVAEGAHHRRLKEFTAACGAAEKKAEDQYAHHERAAEQSHKGRLKEITAAYSAAETAHQEKFEGAERQMLQKEQEVLGRELARAEKRRSQIISLLKEREKDVL